ncbi:MAG: carbohydrate kinase family protein [Anaerolineae bacterium]
MPLGSVQRQLAFLRACRARGARRVSAGTFACAVAQDAEAVCSLMAGCDLFFMNRNEAAGLFGSAEAARAAAGKLLFITLGADGALVVQGDHVTRLPGQPARQLDPTGAGDTFCGATLALLARGAHPVMAARQGIALAAHMIAAAGPAALWEEGPLPQPADDGRVRVNSVQVERVAGLIAALPEVQPFDFTGPDFPPVGHPAALDYFVTATLQQFGFWAEAAGRYDRPLLARLAGAERKGSDYLWQAWLRPLQGDAGFYLPQRQAVLTGDELEALFRADDSSMPMPALALRLAQAQAYGRDMLALGMTAAGLVEAANRASQPLAAFLASLDHVGGYKEDPLRKKAGLLALILAQRPERWLRPGPSQAFPPVIDYHLMRSCLRIGLVDVLDAGLAEALADRRCVSPADEWGVHWAAYRAVETLARHSGRSMGAVDWFFFNARRRCPEMTEPECHRCAVDPVCAHRKSLFQPVLRTVFY